MKKTQIWVIDFGSQYTQLIARKVRELGHSCEIMPPRWSYQRWDEGHRPLAMVFSGGPDSVAGNEEKIGEMLDSGIPILGICYGLQLITHQFGGKVSRGVVGEYGRNIVEFEKGFSWPDVGPRFQAWMSHFDHVTLLPDGFEVILKSDNNLIAGIIHKDKKIVGLQFHPEVHHTEKGMNILAHFFENFVGLEKDWTQVNMLDEINQYLKTFEAQNILCAFSGGVDSLVAAVCTNKIFHGKVHCFFVDHGLVRPQDREHIKLLQKNLDLDIQVIDAKEYFLEQLKGISEPEAKRKCIGKSFIDLFEAQIKKYSSEKGIHFDYLLQGTLYPDVIESLSPHGDDGKSHMIKSHHNVGGLPERMNLKLIEPLRSLFKDEVRKVGRIIGLKEEWLMRHPFPGPGIGIRILGAIDEASIIKVQHSDQILFEELKNWKVYNDTWQAFTVLLPVKTVGIKGDQRAYEEVICLRMVNSTDGMTAHVSQLPWDFLEKVSSRITNEVKGVTRVVYDITSKPPGTIEWE